MARLPWVSSTCLYRALARYALLHRSGAKPTFVMAVDRRGVAESGHAWVELDGTPFEESDDVTRYNRHVTLSPRASRWQHRHRLNDARADLSIHPKCLLTELEDGTGVVLNLETKFYHTLNATAVSLWKALDAGRSTQHGLASKLVADFEVDEATALADVARALGEFERQGLLIRSSGSR